jgi:hypothetical protein
MADHPVGISVQSSICRNLMIIRRFVQDWRISPTRPTSSCGRLNELSTPGLALVLLANEIADYLPNVISESCRMLGAKLMNLVNNWIVE